MFRKSYPHHIGLTGAESEMIHDQRVHQENLEFLMNFDLEELTTQEVQQIRDIAERDFTCPKCEPLEETISDVKLEFDLFIDELEAAFNLFEDYIPRNDKQLIKEYNHFMNKIKKEWQKRKQNVEKSSGLKFENSFNPFEVSYYPDMEEK